MTYITRLTRRTATFGFQIMAAMAFVVFALLPSSVQAQWTTPDAQGNITNTNTGNVGIGTPSPQSRLHVYSPGHNYILSDAPNSNHSVFSLRSNGTETGALYRPAGTNDLRLWAGADRLTVLNSNGHVGIGTTSPSTNLEVVDTDSDAYALRLHRPANSANWGVGQAFSLLNSSSAKKDYAGIFGAITTNTAGAEDGFLDFYTVKTGTLTNQVRITSTGNVGIGTTAPSTKLHVVGNGYVTGNLTVDGIIHAKYQDVAEWVESSQSLAAGTVVVLDHTRSNQVIASSRAYDTRVAGVISLQPGIALGESGAGKVLVATTGRVKIKVDATAGPIRIGDLLVTSDVAGMAMKSEPIKVGGRLMHMPGTLIGKALEPLDKGSEKILVLLSLQ